MSAARRDFAILAAGLCMVLASVVLTCIALAGLGQLTPTVRPATAAEAPSAEYVAGTVVAEPGGSPPLAGPLRGLAIRLLLLGLLAAGGVGLITWALLNRRSPAAPEVGAGLR